MGSLPVGVQFVGIAAIVGEVVGAIVFIALVVIGVKVFKKVWKNLDL